MQNKRLLWLLFAMPTWCWANSEGSLLQNVSIEQAIEYAKAYTSKKGVELQSKSIVKVEYHRDFLNEDRGAYWSIHWAPTKPSKGGGYEVRLFRDGRIEEAFYK